MTLDQQLRKLAALPPHLAGYAVLRRMRLLDAAASARNDGAGFVGQRTMPSLAVGCPGAAPARAGVSSGKRLGFAPLLKSFRANGGTRPRRGTIARLRPAGAAPRRWRTLPAPTRCRTNCGHLAARCQTTACGRTPRKQALAANSLYPPAQKKVTSQTLSNPISETNSIASLALVEIAIGIAVDLFQAGRTRRQMWFSSSRSFLFPSPDVDVADPSSGEIGNW